MKNHKQIKQLVKDHDLHLTKIKYLNKSDQIRQAEETLQKLLKVPFYIEKNSTIEFLTRDFVFRTNNDNIEEEKTTKESPSKTPENPLQAKLP